MYDWKKLVINHKCVLAHLTPESELHVNVEFKFRFYNS